MKNHKDQNQGWTAVLLATLLPLAIGFASPVLAETASAEVQVIIKQPVTMTKTADLVFGDFATGTSSSIFRIDPRSGLLSQRNGDALSLGGTRSVASIEVSNRLDAGPAFDRETLYIDPPGWRHRDHADRPVPL